MQYDVVIHISCGSDFTYIRDCRQCRILISTLSIFVLASGCQHLTFHSFEPALFERLETCAWPCLEHAGQVCITSDKAPRTEKAPTADGVLEADVHYPLGNDLAENSERYPVLRYSRDCAFREEHGGPHWRTTLLSEYNMERRLRSTCVILWRAVDISVVTTLKKVKLCSHIPIPVSLPPHQIKFISLQPQCRFGKP